MKQKLKTYQLGIAIAILLFAISFSFFWINSISSKYVYIELTDIYTEFSLTKKLQTELQGIEMMRKNQIDSLNLSLRLLERKLRSVKSITRDQILEFESSKGYILEKQKEFEEANIALKEKFDDQIWNQINSLIKQYGQENDFEYIFGLNGTGNIMYSKDALNVTQSAIEYINSKYSGK